MRMRPLIAATLLVLVSMGSAGSSAGPAARLTDGQIKKTLGETLKAIDAYADGKCVDGHEVHTIRSSAHLDLIVIRCGADPREVALFSSAPFCPSDAMASLYNTAQQLEYVRATTDRGRVNNRQRSSGNAATANVALNSPDYAPCTH